MNIKIYRSSKINTLTRTVTLTSSLILALISMPVSALPYSLCPNVNNDRLASAAVKSGAENEAQVIAEYAQHAYKYLGRNRTAMGHMEIFDDKKQLLMERKLLIVKQNEQLDAVNSAQLQQKWYAYFLSPADIRGLALAVWKHPHQDDDRWLYLPDLDLVKRLIGADKRGSFAGSQFVYEDITGRYPHMDQHQLLQQTNDYWLIKSTPKTQHKDLVEFSAFITCVDKNTHMPVKRVFFDKQSNPQREYRVLAHSLIETYPTITKFSMLDLQSGGETITTYRNIKYDQNISERLFTEAYLRRTPRKFLR